MTDLTGRGPLGQKDGKPKQNEKHLKKVRARRCVTCGASPPNDAHHCRDRPPYDQRQIYKNLPGAGIKSADEDAISLCCFCHDMFHRDRKRFHDLYGYDYGYIAITRDMVKKDLDWF